MQKPLARTANIGYNETENYNRKLFGPRGHVQGARKKDGSMKPQKAVVQESRRIAIGVAILCAAMLVVFLLLGKMTWLVALPKK